MLDPAQCVGVEVRLRRPGPATRLPDRATLAGFAKAFNVPIDLLLGKSVEALGLGYVSGDFINSVQEASDRELIAGIERRLHERVPQRPVAAVVDYLLSDEQPAAADDQEHTIESEQDEPDHP